MIPVFSEQVFLLLSFVNLYFDYLTVECVTVSDCPSQTNVECTTANECQCKTGFPVKLATDDTLGEGCGKYFHVSSFFFPARKLNSGPIE